METDPQRFSQICAARNRFIELVNAAIEEMRNPDETISSDVQLGMQMALLMVAGHLEACFRCNSKLMTGVEPPRWQMENICGIYDMGFQLGEAEFVKHADDVKALIEQRLIAMQTKVV